MYNGLISHFIQFCFTFLTFVLSEDLKINNFVFISEPPVKKINYYISAHLISNSAQQKMFKENF